MTTPIYQDLFIEPIREDEIGIAASIWLEASIIAHKFIPAKYWESKLEEMKQVYLPNSDTFVLKRKDYIIGFYSLVQNRLAAIFIHPREQNRGFGKLLLNDAKNRRECLELSVFIKNHAASEFYKRNGFHNAGLTKDRETEEVEFCMVWKLNKNVQNPPK
jgi:putative acetyltransferase